MSETKRTGLPYAFVICLCGILSMFCVGAVAGSITAYLPYIIEYGGLTQTQGSSIFTIVCLISLIVTSVLLEPYYRRFSYRTGLALALAGAAVDYLIYSFSTGYVGFVCGALLGGVVYALAGMVPVSIVINAWFADHTAMALGLCAAGTGAASITIPMILSALIERVSLPGVFRVMAVLMAIIAAAVLLLLRDRPQQMGLTAYGTPHSAEQATAPAGRDADRRTMLCMLLGILMLGAVTGGGYQHVSVLYTVAGFSDLQVSRMLSLGGGLMIAGKCLFGVITDRFGTSRTAYLFFAFLMGGWLLCCLAGRQSMPLAVLSVVFINLGMALSTVGLSAIARSISSEQGFGRAAKNFQSFTMIGSIAFNTIPGIIADAAGSYIPAYWIVTAITLASLALVAAAFIRYNKKVS